MAQALRTKDIPEWAAQKAAKKTKKDREDGRKTSLGGKSFEDLTNPEKDLLLKALAVKAGLIDDSDDA
jgi:hypothetical protein